MEYDFRRIEKDWQKKWKETNAYKVFNPGPGEGLNKPKFYVLDMFPYPSGAGLHVGHPLGYIASDIYRPNNMHWIPVSILRKQRRKILLRSNRNWIISVSATTGAVKCKPAIPIIINGRSGSFCSFSTAISVTQKKKQSPLLS